MTRLAYSITASMIMSACRRLLAAATSRAPSPISEVRIAAYSRSSEVSGSLSSASFWLIH